MYRLMLGFIHPSLLGRPFTRFFCVVENILFSFEISSWRGWPAVDLPFQRVKHSFAGFVFSQGTSFASQSLRCRLVWCVSAPLGCCHRCSFPIVRRKMFFFAGTLPFSAPPCHQIVKGFLQLSFASTAIRSNAGQKSAAQIWMACPVP